MAAVLRVITAGYWPLPKFVKLWQGGWKKLKAERMGEKEAEYSAGSLVSSKKSIIILEAEITKALPKKIIIGIGPARPAVAGVRIDVRGVMGSGVDGQGE